MQFIIVKEVGLKYWQYEYLKIFSSMKIRDKSIYNVSLKWREHFRFDQQQYYVEYVLSSIWRHAWYFLRDGDLDSR